MHSAAWHCPLLTMSGLLPDYGWNGVFKTAIVAGEEPLCPGCAALPPWVGATRRASTIGRLRPNMVYLGEDHWHREEIADLIDRDLSAKPEALLIPAPSGPKGGLSTSISPSPTGNGGKPLITGWKCDRWVRDLKMRAPLFHGGTNAYTVCAAPDQSPRSNSLDW